MKALAKQKNSRDQKTLAKQLICTLCIIASTISIESSAGPLIIDEGNPSDPNAGYSADQRSLPSSFTLASSIIEGTINLGQIRVCGPITTFSNNRVYQDCLTLREPMVSLLNPIRAIDILPAVNEAVAIYSRIDRTNGLRAFDRGPEVFSLKTNTDDTNELANVATIYNFFRNWIRAHNLPTTHRGEHIAPHPIEFTIHRDSADHIVVDQIRIEP